MDEVVNSYKRKISENYCRTLDLQVKMLNRGPENGQSLYKANLKHVMCPAGSTKSAFPLLVSKFSPSAIFLAANEATDQDQNKNKNGKGRLTQIKSN